MGRSRAGAPLHLAPAPPPPPTRATLLSLNPTWPAASRRRLEAPSTRALSPVSALCTCLPA